MASEADITDNDTREVSLASEGRSNNVGIVVESGPVVYDEHDQEYLDDDEDEDVHMSAAQLMGQDYGQGMKLWVTLQLYLMASYLLTLNLHIIFLGGIEDYDEYNDGYWCE